MSKRPDGVPYFCLSHESTSTGTQHLAQEAAIAFTFNGINHAVMLGTPSDLEDFAVGFSLATGIVTNPHQILDIEVAHEEEGVTIDITLSARAEHNLRQARRTVVGTSGCGLCGVEALQQALAPLNAAETEAHSAGAHSARGNGPLPPLEHLSGLRDRFRRAQHQRASTGAMHAALFVDGSGCTYACREDIGRHNALDKLLGVCARQGANVASGFVAITSRCSLELIQKAVRAGVSTLVTLASPSDLSVRWAQRYQLNLVHQTAQDAARVYSPAPQAAACSVAATFKDTP